MESIIGKYYEHSGKVGVLGPVYMVLFGFLGALVLGFAYSFLIYYIPFVYLNALITLAYGGLIGLLVGWGAYLGKVRNNKVTMIFALVAGIFAEYIVWVSFVYVATGREFFLYSVKGLFIFGWLVATTGYWSIFGYTPQGALLIFLWVVEALMIIIVAVLVSTYIISKKPFCEKCVNWISNKDIFYLKLSDKLNLLKGQLESSDFSILKKLSVVDDTSQQHILVELWVCPVCQKDFFMSVKISFLKDVGGKVSTETLDILDKLKISKHTYEMLKEHFLKSKTAQSERATRKRHKK